MDTSLFWLLLTLQTLASVSFLIPFSLLKVISLLLLMAARARLEVFLAVQALAMILLDPLVVIVAVFAFLLMALGASLELFLTVQALAMILLDPLLPGREQRRHSL